MCTETSRLVDTPASSWSPGFVARTKTVIRNPFLSGIRAVGWSENVAQPLESVVSVGAGWKRPIGIGRT